MSNRFIESVEDAPRRPVSRLSSFFVSFLVGTSLGAVLIPAIHHCVYGAVDPFVHGWPLCLEFSSVTLAFHVGLGCRTLVGLPLGVYTGLLAIMFVLGESEYPISSAIALAVHGFIPAAVGAALSVVFLHYTRRSAVVSDV